MTFVLDASVTLSWAFEDEGGEYEDAGPNHQIDNVGGQIPRPDRSDQSGFGSTIQRGRSRSARIHTNTPRAVTLVS